MTDPLAMTSPELIAEVRRPREEARALRALHGEPNGAEPAGCPCPGACSGVAMLANARREALEEAALRTIGIATAPR